MLFVIPGLNHKPNLYLDCFDRQVVMCTGVFCVRYSIYTAACGETYLKSVQRSETFRSTFRKIHMGKIVINTGLSVALSHLKTEYRSINKYRSTHLSVCVY